MAEQGNWLTEIIANIPDFLVQSSKAGQKNAEVAQKAAEISRSSADIYREVGEVDAVIESAKNTATLKAQSEIARSAQAAGVDGSGNDALIQLIGESNKATGEVQKNLEEYRKLNETSIWENPVDWIKAQVKLPDAEARLEGAVKTAELYDTRITQVNNQIQQTTQTRKALAAPLTAAAAEASAKRTALIAQLEANRMALEGLKYDSAAINAISGASKEQLSVLFSAAGAQMAEKNYQLSKQRMLQDQAQFDFNAKLRRDALEDKEEAKKVDGVTLQYINAGRAGLGLPAMSDVEFKSAAKLGLPELKYYYEKGTQALATGTSAIGNSAAESIEILQTLPTNLPDIKAETGKKIYQIAREYLESTSEGKMVDKKDKAAVASFINKAVDTQLAQDYSDVKPGSLFDVGELSQYFSLPGKPGMPAVDALSVVKKLLAPAALAKQPLNDTKQVMGLVVAGVKAGTISSTEAQDIATVYQAATLLNNKARDFQAFGVNLPNAGRNHYTSLPSGLLKSSVKIDMTNPTEIGRYLSKELAAQTWKDQFKVDNTGKQPMPLLAPFMK